MVALCCSVFIYFVSIWSKGLISPSFLGHRKELGILTNLTFSNQQQEILPLTESEFPRKALQPICRALALVTKSQRDKLSTSQ